MRSTVTPSPSFENVDLDGQGVRNRATGKRRRRLQWMNESTESTERTGSVTTGLRFNTARLLISGPAQALGWAALLASVYPLAVER